MTGAVEGDDAVDADARAAGCCAVVVNYRTPDLATTCVDSLRADGDLRVVLVDNGSADGSAEQLRAAAASRPWLTVLEEPTNEGFGAGCNRGIEHALRQDPDLDLLLLVNSDAVLQPGSIAALRASAAAHPEAGIIGGRVLSADGARVLFENGVLRPYTLARSHAKAPAGERDFETEFVTGALMCIDAQLLRDGLRFDERYFLYVEDLDLCREVRRRGRSLRVTLDAAVRHEDGGSQQDQVADAAGMRPDQLFYITRNKVRFARRWLRWPQRLVFYAVAGVAKPLVGVLRFRSLAFLRHYYAGLAAGLCGGDGARR